MRSLLLWTPLFVLLPACGEVFAFEDTGGLCVAGGELFYPGPEEEGPMVTTYEADAPVTISVVLEECASGCAEDIEASCTVERDGTTLRVSAEASYAVPGGNPNCPDVCAVVAAECESGPLEAGSYTIEYGSESTSFDVPDTREPATIGNAYCGDDFG